MDDIDSNIIDDWNIELGIFQYTGYIIIIKKIFEIKKFIINKIIFFRNFYFFFKVSQTFITVIWKINTIYKLGFITIYYFV
jgi:hypothetical protein